jgi:long-chain acyl-CoA synthetase
VRLGIAAIAQDEPRRLAIVCNEARISYRELDEASNGMALTFARAGISYGDRVAVMCHNRPELFFAWNGAARLGALVVPIGYRTTPDELAYLLEDSGAEALVHDRPEVVAQTDLPESMLDAWNVDDPGWVTRTSAPPVRDFLGSSVITMAYTSGTTGRPKGIQRPVPEPTAEYGGNAFMRFWGFGPQDVHLLCGPAYHTAPGNYAQMHLMEGASVVIQPRFSAEEALALIEIERVTTTHMVPANFVRILERDWQSYDLSSTRKVLHAAAPCPIGVKRQILDVFPPGSVWEYFGMSEGMGTVISPEEWLAHPGSVGRPFPGVRIRILDENGKRLEAGEVGLIYVSSVPGYPPFAYHRDPDKTNAAWRDGFYSVGDLGLLDNDGYLYIADRRTDLVIRGGVNIYPAEVEQSLIEHRDVVDAAVFGLHDDRMGQRVHAVVELRPGASPDPAALLEWLGRRLAPFKLPSTFEFVEQLPREPTGKIRKAEMREIRLRSAAGDEPDDSGDVVGQ